jgi:hypothetical protein
MNRPPPHPPPPLSSSRRVGLPRPPPLTLDGEPLAPPEAAHLVAAEGRVRVEGEAAVDLDGARAHWPRHPDGDV